jgi:hypothetical protein
MTTYRQDLIRVGVLPDGVIGGFLLYVDDVVHAFVSLEDDWRDNAPTVSCIPGGDYLLKRTVFYKHGYETFEVTGVPGRSRILVHPAVTEESLEGCVGIGRTFQQLRVAVDEDTGAVNPLKLALKDSRAAFDAWMALLQGVDELPMRLRWGIGVAPVNQRRWELT